MFGRLLAFSLLAGLLVPAGSGLAATQSRPTLPGSVGLRLQGPPAGPYIVDHVAPGTSIRRRIEVSNSGAAATSIELYVAAAGVRRGTFGFSAGRSQNALSAWTSVSRGALRLAPGKETAFVTIRVPKDASPGERYAVVWAEVSAPASSGVKLVNRVGIRMYVSVGPGGAAAPEYSIVSIAAKRSATGRPLVVTQIRNDGLRTISVTGTLTLTGGPGGLRAGPFPIRLRTSLAPGRSASPAVELDARLPQGPWRARVALESESVQHSASATLTFPGQAGAAAGSSRTLIAVLAVLLVLAAAGLLIALRFWPRGGLRGVTTLSGKA
ncbi:MAG: hypothetical protein QOH73_1028 [Gaiellaceae bacterium]|jgi:hypothetical protein|nr:hypothetical protein [Gaiellaceae bacterium]